MINKLKIKSKLIFFLLPLLFFQTDKFLAYEINSDSFLKKKELSNNLKSIYLLGEGDRLFIKFSGLEIFTNYYTINLEGYLILPEINKFYASGLSIEELKKSLIKEYKKYIINPNIDIEIANYRPITFYIKGEVNDPGIHTMENIVLLKNEKNKILQEEENILRIPSIQQSISKKLFDAIQIAGGITNNADISNISIVRNNSQTQGGGKIRTNVNIIDLIKTGDQTHNLRILNGDIIHIPTSNKSIKEQLISIKDINLYPSKIKVYINGNIPKPGMYEFKKGANMLQAIASLGGKKILSRNIEFIRYDNKGITQKRIIKFDPDATIGSLNNPILMSGDIINIRKTILGNTAEVLNDISNPLFSGYGLYKIFN